MDKGPVFRKSFDFAADIIKAVRQLRQAGCERELLSQLLRSGTSIGANINEAQSAQSRKDFIAKMSIALKEARETEYWLRLLNVTESVSVEMAAGLLKKVDELIRLLVSIVKTMRETTNINNSKL